VKQDFLVLFCRRLLISAVDLLQVVVLLAEDYLGVLHGIEQIEVLPVLI
jgi:hypothetical protein